MAARRFSLSQILEHKRRLEEQKQRELHELARRRQEAEQELQALRNHADGQRTSLAERERDGGRLDVEGRSAALPYFDDVRGRIAEQEALLAEFEQRVLKSRDELLEILKEKQMLERLRDRHEAAAAADEARREAGEQDDLNTSRYVRDQQSLGAMGGAA